MSRAKIVGLIALVLIAFGLFKAVENRPNNINLWLNDKLFSVTLAQTPAEQVRGLSGRISLKPNEGMLFVYRKPTTPSFWMKEMNFPIDIIWLDQNKQVADISANLSPQTFPQTFSPITPAQYVLEVPANTAAQNNLKIGDLIHFFLP